MIHRSSWILLLGMLITGTLQAQKFASRMDKGEIKAVFRMLQAAPTFAAVLDSLRAHDHHPDSVQIATMREALWQRYLYEFTRDSLLVADFGAGICRYAPGKVGRFSMKIKGSRPDGGYPVYIGLHGGGGAPPEVNDEQWEQMQTYYLKSIDTGIYVAPRGPSNEWNLHFDGEAEQFYNHLLADLRRLAGADPNRIYLLGYSAGGDGVYQLAPRMADQLAGASMSAGHHNGVSPVNLEHVPMLLQVGELDGAYQRNLETVRYARLLDSLARLHPGAYRHQVYVHAQAEHSYVRDRQGRSYQASVLSDPQSWLRDRARNQTTTAVTDAVAWLSGFRRDAFPKELHWDAGTRLQGTEGSYWISMNPKTATAYSALPGVDAQIVPGENRIVIDRFSGPFQIHLQEAMVDPTRPLKVVVGSHEFEIPLRPSLATMAQQLSQHADPEFAYWQTILVSQDSAGKVRVE